MPNDYSLNRSEAAKILQVSQRTVDRYVRAQKLSCNKIGKKILLSRKEVNKLASIRNKMRVDLEHAKKQVDKVDKNVYSDVENTAQEDLRQGIVDKNVDTGNEQKNDSVVDKVDIMDKVDKNVYSDVENTAQEDLRQGIVDKNVDTGNEQKNDSVVDKVDIMDKVDKNVYSDVENTAQEDLRQGIVDKNVDSKKSEDKLYPGGEGESKKSGTNFVVSVYKSLYDEAVAELKTKQKQLEGANYRVGQLESQIKSMVPLLEYKKEQKKLLLLGKQHEEDKEKFEKTLSNKESELKKERINRLIISVIVFMFIVAQPIFWYLWRLSHG